MRLGSEMTLADWFLYAGILLQGIGLYVWCRNLERRVERIEGPGMVHVLKRMVHVGLKQKCDPHDLACGLLWPDVHDHCHDCGIAVAKGMVRCFTCPSP